MYSQSRYHTKLFDRIVGLPEEGADPKVARERVVSQDVV